MIQFLTFATLHNFNLLEEMEFITILRKINAVFSTALGVSVQLNIHSISYSFSFISSYFELKTCLEYLETDLLFHIVNTPQLFFAWGTELTSEQYARCRQSISSILY
jgi:hypothetical protein